MDGVSRHSWFRSARSPSVLLVALIVLLGAGGFILTSTTIHGDRDAAAERRARVEAVNAQEVLGRARAYVAGLADVLAREPEPGQSRFARWADATSASVGLNDVLWVERVPSSQRRRYERLRGVPITRLTASGRLARAPAARSYLPATFTSQTRPELRPGVDVTGFPALAAAIGDRARIFAVGASRPAALGRDSGFYLLEAASFARGRNSRGYLVAFVPRGWFTTTLGGDPRRVAISADGQRIEGRLGSVHASAGFEMLGRHWRINVDRDPPSGLQSLLPWLALAWPFAVAGIALAIGRATTLRRRAQREVERIFELSLDMISVVGFDGRFKAVNPAFERTLGYSRQDMLTRPFSDFVHPDDLDASRRAFTAVLGGDEVTEFESRYVCADGSERWLQWSSRALPEQSAVYSIARDVTERRRIDAELREAQRTAEARGAELQMRAREQAALRRVATLVAREAAQPEVFSAIAEEIGQLLGTQQVRLVRYEGSGSGVVVGTSGRPDALPLGSRQELGDSAASRVLRTAGTARMDDYGTASGPFAETSRAIGVRSAVGAPIVVEGRLWGAIVAASTHDEPLPPVTESRLGDFTELMATAIANTESRARADRLADEQAALRRVATLVAQESSPAEVFAQIAEELAGVLGDADSALFRAESDGAATAVAVWGPRVSVRLALGTRHPIDGDDVVACALREGRPCRIDDFAATTGAISKRASEGGLRSAVGCPIVVRGCIWGVIAVGRYAAEPFAAETETQLVRFAELAATAIANADARAEVERLAEEQAGLRRVATLVAEGASPSAIFDAVAAEMERVLGADGVSLSRYEPNDEVIVLTHRGSDGGRPAPGERVGHHGENVATMVRRAGRSARMEHDRTHGAIDELGRSAGVRASVGAPIVVDGRLWGAAVATWMGEQSPPADTEQRMAQFTELLDTAIANADSRHQLDASRARLVTEADEARRRVVRDLHDGAQQRLVYTIMNLKLAQQALRDTDGEAASLVGEALEHAQRGNAELRELAHGLLPAALTHGGLRAGVDAVAAGRDFPVQVDVPAQRFPAETERSAYFIVAESLTNVVKHAGARQALVRAVVDDAMLHIEVRDDGVGGADPDGHGLTGLRDRATALGGRLDIDSPPGRGTVVHATLPLSH